MKEIIKPSTLATSSGVDRDLLRRADRSAFSHGGVCRMYRRNPMWIEAKSVFDFSTTTSTVDVFSAPSLFPNCPFVILPHMFFVATDWFYYVAAATRDVQIEAGMFNGTSFERAIVGTLLDANFTGGVSPYPYSATAQSTFGMQSTERGASTIFADGVGPAEKENMGEVGAVFGAVAAGSTDYTKFQLKITTTHANRKTGAVSLWIPIDLFEPVG